LSLSAMTVMRSALVVDTAWLLHFSGTSICRTFCGCDSVKGKWRFFRLCSLPPDRREPRRPAHPAQSRRRLHRLPGRAAAAGVGARSGHVTARPRLQR
jgi:hypothetical protein